MSMSLSPRPEIFRMTKSSPVIFPAGSILMTEGDFATSMFAIVEGRVSVTVADQDGGERQVADLKAGDIVGEMSLMTGARRSATVTAETEVVTLEVTKFSLEAILARAPELIDRFGIAEEMRGKITLGPSGRIAVLVASGEVEMAVQQISELLPVTGAQFVGPFPPELQLYTVFSAGVGSNTKDRGAAEAFVKSLTAPSAVPLFKAKGLEPILR